MTQRRPQHRGSHTAALESRRYPARRSPHKRVSGPQSPSYDSTTSKQNRPVLGPLHPNLRRLPSRTSNTDKELDMARLDHAHQDVRAGSKRKRIVSRNENVNGNGRGSLKRLRSVSSDYKHDSSDDTEYSAMDVDKLSGSEDSNESHAEGGDDTDLIDSTDDHLISEAPASQLLRLRKDELIRLYTSAGLLDDAEVLTKQDIVGALITARADLAELPPSSPPRGDGDSSDCSSDDGNVAGDEETDFLPRRSSSLRRRATINDVSRLGGKPVQTRSLSMGHFPGGDMSGFPMKREAGNSRYSRNSHRSNGHDARRRDMLSDCSKSIVHASQSPPATRTRSRKASAPTHPLTPVSSTSNNSRWRSPKGKGKAKQVEFIENVLVTSKPRSKKRSQGKGETVSSNQTSVNSDSDLTELDDDDLPIIPQPSPRRLRSNVKQSSQSNGTGVCLAGRPTKHDSSHDPGRRITPMRRAKSQVSCTQEDVVEGESADNHSEDIHADNADSDEDAEVDQLVATPPPQRGRRTPVKRRLRPRRVQTFTPPSDGDDEGSGEEQVVEEDQEDDGDASATESANGVDIITEPRRLRNGKIVRDEGPDMDLEGEDVKEDISEVDEETPDEEEEVSDMIEDESSHDAEADAEGETDDEPVEEEVDLTVATAKTLIRLRRDDLVRLCASLDLDAAGTKPQLAEALLQWRDRRASGFSSPSSTGTVRPPSTVRRRKHARAAEDPTTPVLLRSDRVHLDEPRTPPLSKDNNKDHEPELELDLESLGLEDREIPYDKLTKLEKIGSGGFKDVFVGKLKGRKIAIAEFRGQLSAMDIKELKLLGGFNHPNIVRFLGVSIPENTKETPVMILSELCSNGDLFDYIRNVPPPSLRKVLNIMLDIARGLEYLHLRKPSVIHRDCKSSNILITSRGTAKIADFGLAKVKQSTRSMVRSLVGTVNWQAPELWTAHPKYNHKVDVFSCAMVFWEMLQWHLSNKKFPWEGMNEHAIYEIVGAKRQRPSISGLRKQWCPEIIDLIERMWAHEHQDRLTMSAVVERLEQLLQMY